jgi:hypothetical protein
MGRQSQSLLLIVLHRGDDGLQRVGIAVAGLDSQRLRDIRAGFIAAAG